ncbi:putative carboxylesterase [Rosa chinensis]|uniref:Putative carboxylesterase n=2 Tax=Rosa chinensis TaxID=74649 RepID=A0A2P6QYM6_ROSCH|nr:putative carboxylesterase [Rosa chinensis]
MSFLDLRSSATPSAPYKGVTTSNVTVHQTRNLWFRFFVPSTTSSSPASLPVVVFFHDGGFSFLSPDSYAYDAVCSKFPREIPAVVVSVNYRLSPEHGYPCQYDDGLNVLKFLDQNPDSLPDLADCSRCFLAGDSADANIAHHVAVRACREPFRVVKPIRLISIQPFFGGEERTESEIRLEGAPLVSVTRTDWLWKAFLPQNPESCHKTQKPGGFVETEEI